MPINGMHFHGCSRCGVVCAQSQGTAACSAATATAGVLLICRLSDPVSHCSASASRGKWAGRLNRVRAPCLRGSHLWRLEPGCGVVRRDGVWATAACGSESGAYRSRAMPSANDPIRSCCKLGLRTLRSHNAARDTRTAGNGASVFLVRPSNRGFSHLTWSAPRLNRVGEGRQRRSSPGLASRRL
jgi:hypothetical protein